MNPKNKSLAGWRNQIDGIDAKLLRLIARRMMLSRAIGEYKANNHLPVLAEDRWRKMLAVRLARGAALGIPEALIANLFENIHNHSIALQNTLRKQS